MRTWHLQGARFLIVGLTSNLVLYLLYLALTTFGLGHKVAMSLLYVLGTLQTFVFNKHWTFSHRGGVVRSVRRYLFVYLVGYLFNLTVLAVLVDGLGWPHALVQGAVILILAILFFLAQRYWVFAASTRSLPTKEMA